MYDTKLASKVNVVSWTIFLGLLIVLGAMLDNMFLHGQIAAIVKSVLPIF